MKPTRWAYRTLNGWLEKFGLSLVGAALDFEARPVDDLTVGRMLDGISGQLAAWYATNEILVPSSRVASFDFRGELETFYKAYIDFPLRQASGGSRFNNLAALYIAARITRPPLIVDSGTFTGASAWALALGSPESQILSFDIDLSRLQLRTPGVKYVETDWTGYDFTGLPVDQALCYFDDHVDQAKRLIEMSERGFRTALFDDDFSVFFYAPYAHGGFSLPKIEFLLDESLKSAKELAWVDRGRHQVWPIDHAYFDKARALITAADRFPDALEFTGIAQLPYRVVSIRAA